MNRQIVYPLSIPLDTDLLNTNRNTMDAIGWALTSIYGENRSIVTGLIATPFSPGLIVQIGPGAITWWGALDATAYGSLPAVTGVPLTKMGINTGYTYLPLTAPTTAGQSVNYLIEAQFSETDGTPIVLPYVNSANPALPYSGPNNTGAPNNTVRAQTVALQAKAGTPATTGSQTTPAVDANWTALYVVTIDYGQTLVTSDDIVAVASAPIVPYNLQDLTPGFRNRKVITTTQTWTVPQGIFNLRITAIGAGAGGGGSTGATGVGGGGGAGGMARALFTPSPGDSIVVTIGSYGTGGSGGNGGNSTVTTVANSTASVTYITINPATGGAYGSSASGTSGVGGTVTIASDVTGSAESYAGGDGSVGYPVGGSLYMSGNGGASPSFSQHTQVSGTSTVGFSAVYPGCGGNGGLLGGAGGNGSPGQVIIEW